MASGQLKSPAPPKRGLSAYMFFANENRERIRSEQPGLAFGQYGLILGETWKSLSEEEKAKYFKMSEDDKARYEREMARYRVVTDPDGIIRVEDIIDIVPLDPGGNTRADEKDDSVVDDQNSSSHGTSCSLKVLYEGPTKCSCCVNWVEEPPIDFIEERIEDREENRRHALLVRKRKNHGEGKPFVVDSIVVQSDALKGMLKEVFTNYTGIYSTMRKLVFKPPFNEFFFEWTRFNEICEAQPEPIKDQAGLLQDVLREELKETISTTDDLAKNNVIEFDYLWTIFRSGIDVYSKQRGYDCIYKVSNAEHRYMAGDEYFQLDVQYVTFDGKNYGWDTTKLVIWKFSGTRPIAELEVVPTTAHPTPDVLRSRLIARGKAFREYTQPSYHYSAFRGLAKDTTGKKFNVDGRVVIDELAFSMFNTAMKRYLDPIDLEESKTYLDLQEDDRSHRSGSRSRSSSPPVVIRRRSRRGRIDDVSSRSSSRSRPEKEEKRPELDDAFLYYCDPEVRGYCLKTKRWATFPVDNIHPIRWNWDAFDSLVMATDLKRMILSFVETQTTNKDSFDDIIEGKGRGIILLLEGSPGVGKTLTAEAVADKLHRPLYTIGGGELGPNAWDLERNLEMILEIAAKWDAVLLLDECDVFLEKRSADNMKRNGVVAVFLRTLEYYNGILFMTTNRVDVIDPAFKSRIHLTIQYPELDFNARKQVWKRFLDTFCPDSKMTMRDVQELAEEEVNGREIKNLIKTAQLLARHEKVPLGLVHVKTVLSVTKRKLVVEMKKPE